MRLYIENIYVFILFLVSIGMQVKASSKNGARNNKNIIDAIEVLDSSLLLLDRLNLRKISTISHYARQNQEITEQNFTNSRRCTCLQGVCECCTGYLMDLINQKACIKVTSHSGDFGFTISINDRILYENSVSGRNPRPMCFSSPRLSDLIVCTEFYKIFYSDRNFYFCLTMTGKWQSLQVFRYDMDCLRMGDNGIDMLSSEESGRLTTPNPQGGVDAVDDAGEDDTDDISDE